MSWVIVIVNLAVQGGICSNIILFLEESFFKCFYIGFSLAPSISRKYQLNLEGQRIFRTCLPQALFGQDHCALQIPQMLTIVRTVYWWIKSLPYGNKWSNASASVPLGASCFVGAEMGSSGERAMADLWGNTWSPSYFLSFSAWLCFCHLKGFLSSKTGGRWQLAFSVCKP